MIAGRNISVRGWSPFQKMNRNTSHRDNRHLYSPECTDDHQNISIDNEMITPNIYAATPTKNISNHLQINILFVEYCSTLICQLLSY